MRIQTTGFNEVAYSDPITLHGASVLVISDDDGAGSWGGASVEIQCRLSGRGWVALTPPGYGELRSVKNVAFTLEKLPLSLEVRCKVMRGTDVDLYLEIG